MNEFNRFSFAPSQMASLYYPSICWAPCDTKTRNWKSAISKGMPVLRADHIPFESILPGMRQVFRTRLKLAAKIPG